MDCGQWARGAVIATDVSQNRGFNRRGEKRKHAQSHIGPQGESTASN